MESEKDKVSLVVESGDLATYELRVVRKESGKHASNAVAQTSGEVVQNHLWVVICWVLPSPLHLLPQSDTADFEVGCGSIRKVTKDHTIGHFAIFIDDHEVGEVPGDTLGNDPL